jgi:cellulose synthase/poly-beta-1,6-N-acetylglucosamine synthase-like glycosyltransferase
MYRAVEQTIAGDKLHCCIGIMAFNEEANIGRLLDALLSQDTRTVTIDEILVVASGCTDQTEEIVLSYARRDRRVRLLHQAQREGKASAVNLLMRNSQSPVIVLESADTLPLPDTIEKLVTPMHDPQIGMTGGRPVPTNPSDKFMGYGAQLLWELHHQVSLRHPKMGELIAFRNIFQQIPIDSAVDEASIEPLIIGQGLRLHYVPEAIVRNRGPQTIRDFLKQRRRIFAGHLFVKDTVGYKVSTLNGFRIVSLFIRNFKWDWRYLIWGTGIGLLEIYARLLATYDYVIWKRRPYTWPVAETTKDLAEVS